MQKGRRKRRKMRNIQNQQTISIIISSFLGKSIHNLHVTCKTVTIKVIIITIKISGQGTEQESMRRRSTISSSNHIDNDKRRRTRERRTNSYQPHNYNHITQLSREQPSQHHIIIPLDMECMLHLVIRHRTLLSCATITIPLANKYDKWMGVSFAKSLHPDTEHCTLAR